jgi:hypothetical protein
MGPSQRKQRSSEPGVGTRACGVAGARAEIWSSTTGISPARRKLALPGGLTLEERLEAFDDPGRRLSYAIVAGPIPVASYLATIEVCDEGSGCRIDWSSTFEPRGISDDQARGMIEGVYKGGIAGIKRALGA